jgi:hypothetical protein
MKIPRFQLSLRAFLILVISVGLAFGCFNEQLQWQFEEWYYEGNHFHENISNYRKRELL